MGKWNLWLSGLVLGLGVAACEVLHESDFYSSEVGVWFDPQMPPPSRQALLETYQFLNQLELDTTEVAHFSDIFGGHGTSALTNFLSERVHYFLGPDSPVSLQISGQRVELPGPGPGVVARNMGAFFLAEARDVGAGLELFIGETKVPASTFGAGYLQLSQLFFSTRAGLSLDHLSARSSSQ